MLYRTTVDTALGVVIRATEGDLCALTGRSAAGVHARCLQLASDGFIERRQGGWCLYGTADLSAIEIEYEL